MAMIAPLKVGFYQKSCPSAEAIVKSTVNQALATDNGVPAALIRLHVHDCFGCDASILLDSTPANLAEKDSPANLGISGFDVIDQVKANLEAACPQTVSCADIVAFAARDGVSMAGGTYYAVPGGRRDGTVSLAAEAAQNLPGSFFNVTQLRENFAKKGLSMAEMVTLSGAHSIGDSHCSSFSKRLYSFNSTYSQDPSMNLSYANYLRTKCPRPASKTNSTSTVVPDPVVPFDPVTPNLLDNNYYKILESHKGLVASDQVLWSSSLVTRKMVKNNANHPGKWASKFAEAMVKMGEIDLLTGVHGEIRKNCRVVN
ncbi:unnamed protein product [Ilex paraguariensis]|uniref:Peroxidase n=1 Tax=Ilex paraguariensis TaxID=185542 RepID=A0ABC8RKT2_9AQUA